MREGEGIFGVENAVEIFQHVPGDSGRPLKSVVITGPSLQLLALSKRNILLCELALLF